MCSTIKHMLIWLNRKHFTHVLGEKKKSSHLNLLYNLFAKGADLRRDTDGDVLCSAVLAAHSIEHARTLLNVAAQVRLKKGKYGCYFVFCCFCKQGYM